MARGLGSAPASPLHAPQSPERLANQPVSMRHAFVAVAFVLASIPRVARAVASAELYHTQTYYYGRFEARVRFAAADGVVSSFFLWKVGSENEGAYWNELDFEKLGADCHVQTNALFGNPAEGHEQVHTVAADLCSSYHEYRFEWTPDYIAWAIDGEEIRRETGEVAVAFAQNAGSGMRIHFNVWTGNEDFGGNFDPESLPVHQYVSWAQYSSYDGSSFQIQWREEFDGGDLPNGWAVGNWASPFGLSTHSPENVGFVDGFAVLSLTADDSTGFVGTPPDDVDTSTSTAGGMSTGGTSSDGMSTVDTGTGGAGGDGTTTTDGAMSDEATGGTSTVATAGVDSTSNTGTSAGGDASGSSTTGGTTVGGSVSEPSTSSVVGGGGLGTSGAATGAASAPSNGHPGCACETGRAGGHCGASAVLGALAFLLRRRRRPGANSGENSTTP